MLLTLAKKRKTRYGWQALLIDTNHLTGDRLLAQIHIWFCDWPLPLFYPVNITRSGIHIRGKRLKCTWKKAEEKQFTEQYLRCIQKSREEIFIEVV